MRLLGMNSNIMSLGGIAIAIGAMVDAAIVMIENAHKRLERAPPGKPRVEVLIEAAVDTGRVPADDAPGHPADRSAGHTVDDTLRQDRARAGSEHGGSGGPGVRLAVKDLGGVGGTSLSGFSARGENGTVLQGDTDVASASFQHR